MNRYGIVAHGGAGSPANLSDGCREAAAAGAEILGRGGAALDAVVEAARILEEDGRFNAGRGSVPRLDGKTTEMDAAVMDSLGNLGVVISIRGIMNPVLVARAVIDTPHVALSGHGAAAFAKKRGFKPFGEMSPIALERYREMKQRIREGRVGDVNPLWRGHSIESLWNFEEMSYGAIFSCDTVGVVAMDKQGNMAVANSTGGALPMMLGRVGDSPMVGCGFFAGPACAVAVTGLGEEIIRRMLAKTVYDMVSKGLDVRTACEEGIKMFPPEIPVGVIGISRTGHAMISNREMAAHAVIGEE